MQSVADSTASLDPVAWTWCPALTRMSFCGFFYFLPLCADVVTCRYVTSLETGSQPVTDIFHFVVYDGDNNRLDNQMCTITITSRPREPPVVTVRSGIKVFSL